MTTETPTVWRSLREASGLSLREVARRTGINPGRLSSIERGPTPEEAQKLRAVLAAEMFPADMVDVKEHEGGRMNCTGIARFCDGSQPRPHRLTGITPDKPIRNLCAACLEAAKNLGYQPEPVPTWIARGVGKDLTGALVA